MSDTDTNLLRNTIASVQKPGWLMEHAAPGSVAKLLADLSAPLLDEVERLRSELSSWREAAAEWERAAVEWEQAAKESLAKETVGHRAPLSVDPAAWEAFMNLEVVLAPEGNRGPTSSTGEAGNR